MRKIICYVVIFTCFVAFLPIPTSAEIEQESPITYIPNDDNLLVGSIDREGQICTYDITPASSGDMVIYKANDLRIWPVLYDENMKQMDVIRDPSVFHVEKGHHYYLKVQMVINIPETTGEYKFKIILPSDTPSWNSKYEPNDTLGLAYPFQSGQILSADIEFPSDRDLYKIDVTKTGEIFATITNQDYFMQIFDESGKNLNWYIQTESYGESVRKWVTPGRYYISIGSNIREKIPYRLQITYPNNNINLVQNSFGEPNNVLQEAKLLERDKLYHFKFEDETDVDWYKFVLTEPKRIVIEGTQEQFGIGPIEGYSGNGELVREISHYWNTQSQPDYYQQYSDVLPPGTYYIFVFRYNKFIKSGNYTLKLTTVSVDDITYADTKRLPLNQPFTSKMDYSWDKDPFVYMDTAFDGWLQLRVHSKFPSGLEIFYDYGNQETPVITRDGNDTVYTFPVRKQTYYYLNIFALNGEYGDSSTYTILATRKPETAPEITGVVDKSIPIDTEFDPAAGVKARDTTDGDLTSFIQISGTFNVKVKGVYWLTYTVKDSWGYEKKVTRKITVYDNVKPLLKGITNKTIYINSAFNPRTGVGAYDNVDGNLTSAIKISGTVNTKVKGVYALTYSVKDSSGNTSTIVRKVTVKDNIRPVIYGAKSKTIKKYSSFRQRSGITAKDNSDGNLTSKIKISGSVNTRKKGTYTLTYYVYDKSGNKATVKRKITVK
ncbi:DUF5011 domain-containing protein [Neobacillus soli]|uniref:DUF5011 domain-containing protein n=1 Tax=Neobacillus soli TaxID=220688 RepID=UPI00082619F4|nr:DUF5011 domain-containing protein [Neobacillus soli]